MNLFTVTIVCYCMELSVENRKNTMQRPARKVCHDRSFLPRVPS